ncbi:hypothetical protein GCM10010377_81540 [Streptomyces viridiviolaceus]|uniref:Uncharacterized protein n=1 Tax=Streptomyces viridiviolaceus TaxID=68282 RepID=A0ABW2EGZ7_9ACTN|nr:hypothetical protein [Streptomyces viridiviolaceus]GHB79201.1 hypothetical protein GCM10010377_81540 [Streptomyces viridiviolaceus]
MTVRVESNSYLTEEQHQVYQLRDSLERNGGTPIGFLELLAAVLAEGTWKKVPSGVNRDEPFSSFAEFIEANPPFGLGASVENVRVLLQLRHPHEGVPRIREQMDAMRAEVTRLLGPGPERDPIARDARFFGAYDRNGGWVFGLLVARSVQPGTAERRPNGTQAADDSDFRKVSASRFAEMSGTSAARVMRYYRAWERAAADGKVPGFDKLAPGHEIDLPDASLWGDYFTVYEQSTDRRERIAEEAKAAGTSYTEAMKVAKNPAAMRTAILGDPKTAEAARDALLERTELRTAVVAKAMSDPVIRKEAAAQTRKAERIEFVRQVATGGKAKTPAGQVIELPSQARQKVSACLAAVEDLEATPETITDAYETVREVIEETVESDRDLQAIEQRTQYLKALKSTAKGIESIDPQQLATVLDDDVRQTIRELQQTINMLAESIADPNAEALRLVVG